MVPKVRTSFLTRRPAAPMMTQATTEPWCTSSPAARSMIASMATSRGGGRGAAGRETEAGPRAGRTVPAATLGGPWTRRGPVSYPGSVATYPNPASARPPAALSAGTVRPAKRPYFHPEVVRGMRSASLIGFRGGEDRPVCGLDDHGQDHTGAERPEQPLPRRHRDLGEPALR